MFKWLTKLLVRENAFGGERDPRWREVRAEHILKEPVCQACGKDIKLDVHHIVPVAIDKSRELDPENLITLCNQPCHLVFGHFMSYYCYNSDVREMTKIYRQSLAARKCMPGKT